MFERARMGVAVALAAALLVFSGYALNGLKGFTAEPTPAKDVAEVRAALAILEKAKTPITGMQPCDAIKAFLPDKFSRADGDRDMKTPTPYDVILCFKGDIDYGDALEARQTRKLDWIRGLAGDKIVVFAPSEERFLAVARENNLDLRPDDLKALSLYLGQLQPHPQTHKEGSAWRIDPMGGNDEALFGPYLDLDPGVYRLRLGFEPEGVIPCRYFASRLRADLEVTAAARVTTLAARQHLVLKPSGKGCRVEAEASFTVPPGGARSVETPIWIDTPFSVRLVGYDLLQ